MSSKTLIYFIFNLFLINSGDCDLNTEVIRESKIVGGHLIVIELAPYQISLRRNDQHFCGGSIINPTTIVSAAHCVDDVGTSVYGLSIRAGSTYQHKGGVVRNVLRIVVHPKYNPLNLNYDVSVFKIQQLSFGRTIRSVQLPSREPLAGFFGFVSGFGLTNENGKNGSNQLRGVLLPIVSRSTCNKLYNNEITNQMICAGYMIGRKDSCQGDSGGGFVSSNILYGIISSGNGCAKPGYPGIYTNVFALKDFQTLSSNNTNKSTLEVMAFKSVVLLSIFMFLITVCYAFKRKVSHQYKPASTEVIELTTVSSVEVELINALRCSSSDSDLRIVGGFGIDIEMAPYQISLQRRGQHFCGGSIINPTTIVTAAHCKPLKGLTVKAGVTYHNSLFGQTRKVKKSIWHPLYNSETIDYDIAVLHLECPLTFSSSISAIRIPNKAIKAGTRSLVTGWGVRREGSRDIPMRLQAVKVPVISRSSCKQLYGRSRITPQMICAGIPGKGECQGDSGGALEINGQLVGVSSWGIGCARRNYPGVFANVRALLPFIKANVD
ncbi:unnamed protein product [Diamesa tonsa]